MVGDEAAECSGLRTQRGLSGPEKTWFGSKHSGKPLEGFEPESFLI